MLNQENIYHLILHGHWTAIITILYKHKEDIAGDTMLSQAAITFEQEFFNKVTDYPKEDADILANLDKLYILNHGNFYKLKDENFKKLVLEMVKRKPIEEAFNYAQLFPEEEVSKVLINQFQELGNVSSIDQNYKSNFSDKKWIEIYNRLFELINKQQDVATYFSGPKFINTVREFVPYHPTYEQYIELRNKEGKSTSRKIFYYDILFELSDSVRIEVIKRILNMVKPFEREKSERIEELLGLRVDNGVSKEDKPVPSKSQNPIVFISYSWDNEAHKNWVLNLAKQLQEKGVEVLLDQYELRLGKNLPHFVEQSILKADRILVIFTPNYKLKADDRKGGVGYEYSIMNAKLYQAQTKNEKIIPILRAGIMTESIPDFMQQFIHLDMTQDVNFENSITDLLREIFNEPVIKKPALGGKPTFD